MGGGVGFEHLSPTASHPVKLGSSDLIRGPLRSGPGYKTVGFLYDMHVLFPCFVPWSLSFGSRVPPLLYQIHLLLLLY